MSFTKTLRDLWPRARPIWLAAGVIGAVGAALIVFLVQPDWDWARGFTASFLSARMHRTVHVNGPIRVFLLSPTPTVTLSGVTVAEPASAVKGAPKQNLAEIAGLSAQPDLLPLFIGQLHLRRLELDRPVIAMFQDGDGRSNWDFSDGRDQAGASRLPPARMLIVRQGFVSVTMVNRRLSVSGFATADVASGFRYEGTGSEDGRPCHVVVTGPQLGNGGKPYPFQVDLTAGSTQILARGTFPRPFDFGLIRADMHLRGASLADLYYLLSVSAPNTPAFDLGVHLDRDRKLYTVSGVTGHVGGSDLEGGMTVDRRGPRPLLTADLSSRVFDMAGLSPMFGGAAARASRAAASSRLMPDAPLDVERFRAVDARVRYRALSVRGGSGMAMRGLSFRASLDRGLLRFDPVNIDLSKGQVSGTVTLNARGTTPREAVDLKLTGARLETFAKGDGPPPMEGAIGARLQATGAGNSVHGAVSTANGEVHIAVPGGEIRQALAEALGIDASKSLFLLLAKDQHETNIRCGVADFRLHNGLMKAQRIVLDTGVVLVNGSGGIDLRDERINLVLRGKPKAFRLIRIKAPIVIGGSLARPTFGISGAPAVAQTGLAAAVGSVLPFINLDYAKDADCAALLKQAQ